MGRELRKELALRTGRLMFITHPNSQNSLQEQLEGYVNGGGRLVQIRLKGVAKEELSRVVTRVVGVMDELGGSVIVNDNWEPQEHGVCTSDRKMATPTRCVKR